MGQPGFVSTYLRIANVTMFARRDLTPYLGFFDSSEGVSFSIEGDDGVPILRATMFNVDGNPCACDINLGERIGNNDGQFYIGEDISQTWIAMFLP
jgi:hypothetical protein